MSRLRSVRKTPKFLFVKTSEFHDRTAEDLREKLYPRSSDLANPFIQTIRTKFIKSRYLSHYPGKNNRNIAVKFGLVVEGIHFIYM